MEITYTNNNTVFEIETKIIRIDFENDDYYEGAMHNNLYHGIGKLRENELIYIGDFVEGKKDGKGKLFSVNDLFLLYDGDWLNNEKSGFGQLSNRDGSCYIGDFQRNARHGKGKYMLTNESYYEGDFKENKMEGKVFLYNK